MADIFSYKEETKYITMQKKTYGTSKKMIYNYEESYDDKATDDSLEISEENHFSDSNFGL